MYPTGKGLLVNTDLNGAANIQEQSRVNTKIQSQINGKLKKVTDAAVGFKFLAVKGV